MGFYLVSYDLRKPDYDYQPLYDELENYDATRVQESVWVLCSNQNAGQIHNVLWQHMHSSEDRLLVTQMKDNWKSINAIRKIKPLSDECE